MGVVGPLGGATMLFALLLLGSANAKDPCRSLRTQVLDGESVRMARGCAEARCATNLALVVLEDDVALLAAPWVAGEMGRLGALSPHALSVQVGGRSLPLAPEQIGPPIETVDPQYRLPIVQWRIAAALPVAALQALARGVPSEISVSMMGGGAGASWFGAIPKRTGKRLQRAAQCLVSVGR